MAWIESHQTLRDHPKTKRAAHRLGISSVTMVGHLQFLWWWALDFAQDGDLSDFDAFEIADAAGWQDDPETFIEALVECGPGNRPGFLARNKRGLVIHDWMDFAGKLIERREAERERSRQRRAAQSKVDQQTTGGQPADNQQTTDGTVPNRTQPNRTVPNRKEPAALARCRDVVTQFGVTDDEFDRSLETHAPDDCDRLPAIAEEFVAWHDEKGKRPKSPYRSWLTWLKKDREFRQRDGPHNMVERQWDWKPARTGAEIEAERQAYLDDLDKQIAAGTYEWDPLA